MHVELIHRWKCPYSARVRDFISRHHLEDQVYYRAADEDAAAQEALAELTHGNQVPCLIVDGTPILESTDIIQWLNEHMVHHERHVRPFGLPVHGHHPST